jgi:hypothetical protein
MGGEEGPIGQRFVVDFCLLSKLKRDPFKPAASGYFSTSLLRKLVLISSLPNKSLSIASDSLKIPPHFTLYLISHFCLLSPIPN